MLNKIYVSFSMVDFDQVAKICNLLNDKFSLNIKFDFDLNKEENPDDRINFLVDNSKLILSFVSQSYLIYTDQIRAFKPELFRTRSNLLLILLEDLSIELLRPFIQSPSNDFLKYFHSSTTPSLNESSKIEKIANLIKIKLAQLDNQSNSYLYSEINKNIQNNFPKFNQFPLIDEIEKEETNLYSSIDDLEMEEFKKELEPKLDDEMDKENKNKANNRPNVKDKLWACKVNMIIYENKKKKSFKKNHLYGLNLTS